MTNKAATAQTQTPAPAAAPAKEPSKMELCREVFKEIYAEGYDLKGDSQRQCFIKRTMAEHGISKHCANTYFQNLSNERAGKGLYKYNKYQSKKGATAPANTGGEAGQDLPGANVTPAAKPAPAPTKAQVKAAEKGANKTAADLTKRWQVKDGSGNVVNSFDTRKEAKDAADADPVATWADRDAKKS